MIGSCVVIAYDTIAAVISLVSGLPYGWFTIGSFASYAIFGFLAARYGRWFYGILGGAVVGIADSTVGWAITWHLGPGKWSHEHSPGFFVAAIVLVLFIACILGLIGGLLSLIGKKNA